MSLVSNIFTESIILVSSIILATTFTGIIISKAGTLEAIFTSTTASKRSTILTDIKIIYATNTTSSTIVVWVKNIGKQPIVEIESVDVYFGAINSVNRIPYSASSTPSWAYEDNSIWDIMETKKIIINYGTPLSQTTYLIKVTTPNGVSNEYIFSPMM